MSSWAIVAIVAILVWGVVQLSGVRKRSAAPHESDHFVQAPRDEAAEREIEELRERIAVLERIATDGHSVDARETRRIAEEIEQLRNSDADRATTNKE